MKPEESFLSQPIRSLQTMLRVLAEQDDRYDTLVPDGIYGSATQNAVSKFQRIHGLPVTGITDHLTWETIVREYELAFVLLAEAQELAIALEPNEVIRKGQRNTHLYLVQAMLQALEDAWYSIGAPSHNGILDAPTSQSISAFQGLTGLPMTGELDKRTWKHLALHYPTAARRVNRPANMYNS